MIRKSGLEKAKTFILRITFNFSIYGQQHEPKILILILLKERSSFVPDHEYVQQQTSSKFKLNVVITVFCLLHLTSEVDPPFIKFCLDFD